MLLLTTLGQNGEEAKDLYTKMPGAHPRPQFLVDERVLIVLKCTETNSVLKQPGVFKGSFRIRGRCRQTLMDRYMDKYVKMVYYWKRTSTIDEKDNIN